MKHLILGKLGIGKTTLIVKEIIPTIEKYLVLDFCNEYSQWIKDESKLKINENGLIGDKLKKQVINIIRNTGNDTTLIIDNTNLLYFPKTIDEKDGGFLWLKKELENKSFILVFQSIESVINGGIANIFDDIHYFPTKDNDDTRTSYLAYQLAKKKNVIVRNGFNPR